MRELAIDADPGDHLGSRAFGNAVARTPNIDALAARGTRFTQAYSQHSACSQSRIAMMTVVSPCRRTSDARQFADAAGAESARDPARWGLRLDEEPQNELRAGYPYDVKAALLHDEPMLAGRAVAVRTDAWTYVYRACEASERYDRIRDPGETTNVATEPGNVRIATELRDRVLAWLVDSSDVIPRSRDPRMDPALVEQFL